MAITGAQCRAARALTEISRPILASRSGVAEQVIEEFERKITKPDPKTIDQLQRALEEAGAQFLPEDGGGVGVRLKFTASETKRLQNLENEGGIAAADDVP